MSASPAGAPAVGMPTAGELAPDFELRDHNARLHRLSSYRGTKRVVVVFYPFAFTGVCSGELAAVQSALADMHNDDTEVLAISCDPIASLRAFAERDGLEFPLLSDFWPHGAVAAAYGVFNETLGAAERGTFVIDKQGVVRWTTRVGMGEARDVADYVKALGEL